MNMLTLLIVAAMIATAITLMLGIVSMGHGGSYDRAHSTQFMWTRVALQGLVLVLLALALLAG